MLLVIKERILLLQSLPKEGDLFTVKIIKDLKDKIGLTDSDWGNYEIKTTPEGRVEWNVTKDIGMEIELGDKSLEIIRNSLMEIDKKKKVTEDFFSLFEKFLPGMGKDAIAEKTK